jgi:hypothetical protein
MLFILRQPETSIYNVASPVLMPLNVGGQSLDLNRRLTERLYGTYPPNYLTSIDSLYLKIELKMQINICADEKIKNLVIQKRHYTEFNNDRVKGDETGRACSKHEEEGSK